ncbi:hypothetical protein EK904_008842 [Melospiza melodia maxima]|nr:hypothetical protein EK904_008842 [Melospiza melodia maxima]
MLQAFPSSQISVYSIPVPGRRAAVSFDLYSKPGNNSDESQKVFLSMETLSLCMVSLQRAVHHTTCQHMISFFHCRTRSLRGATNVELAMSMKTPGRQQDQHRWCGPGAWTPLVVCLTSSSNVMLLTFSLDQRGESNILKAHFQAVPKISK